MDVFATVTAKGQITLPKQLRVALGLKPGDRVLFRVYPQRAVLAKVPDFLTLAGSVRLPASRRGAGWPEIRRLAWQKRATSR